MAGQEAPQKTSVGTIVEIKKCSDATLVGCKGEVISEKPFTIAIMREVTLDANEVEVETVFDAAACELKADLLRKAQDLDVPVKASATKDDIIGKIKGVQKHDGRVKEPNESRPEAGAETGVEALETREPARATAADDGFETGQRVEVTSGDFKDVRGEVVDGTPRVRVELDGGLGTVSIPPGNLKKV